jgi:hypothetical protein
MERVWGMPVGVIKLADGIRPALVFVAHPAFCLGMAETVAAHHPLNSDR